MRIMLSTAIVLLTSHAALCVVLSSTPREETWVTNGEVSTIVKDGDKVYLGGKFTYVGPKTGCGGVVLDTATGIPRASFPKMNGWVLVAVSDNKGGWFIGGAFDRVGTYIRNHIAHLLYDNSVDTSWNPNANGYVRALSVSGNSVYTGGEFDTICGQARDYIASIDATTGLVTNWNPNADGYVKTLSVSGNSVYAGGEFSIIGGQTRNFIACLDSTTGLSTNWNPNADGIIYTMSAKGNSIFVGGNFRTIGGQTRLRIACLDAATGLVTNWNPNPNGPNITVYVLSISGNKVYAGGIFDSMGGQPRYNIACLDATTGHATDWNPFSNSSVLTLSESGNKVYVGGAFDSIGGQNRNYIACLDATSGRATDWNPNANEQILCLSISGNSVYAGGYLTSIGGQTRNHIACINATTGHATDWNLNMKRSLVDVPILDIAISGNSVYVGGRFTSIGGQARNNIACIDATSGLATDWNPNANGTVSALSVNGNNLYVGGGFTSIGGQTRNYIACIDTTTGLATDWNPNASFYVEALCVSGNNIYVGGDFKTIGGQTRSRIACLDATTGLATDWNPNSNSHVNALLVSGNSVYVGGEFESIGGQDRNYIACIDATTGLATDWNPNASDGDWNYVEALSKCGNYIYAGGGFSRIGGQKRPYFASLDETTGRAAGWIPNPDGIIKAIFVSEHSVYIGGNFCFIGDSLCPSFAQFDFITPQPPHISSITPDTQAIANGTIHISAIAGTNFSYVASAKLVKSGKPDIIATNLSIVSSTRITCDFNLDSADTGLWDIIISDQENQSDTLVNGFTIIERALPSVPLLIAPSDSAVNQPFSLAFRWHYAERATSYDCQISLDSDFTSIIVDTTALLDTAATFSIPRESFCVFYWRVRAVNPSGNGQWSDTWSFTSGNSPVRFNGDKALTNSFTFPPSSRLIRYSLAHSSPVSLRVFDMRGRQMASLINRYQAPGTYAVSLGSQSLPAGFYLFSFKAGDFTVIRRYALVR
jgi:hypothetical protein